MQKNALQHRERLLSAVKDTRLRLVRNRVYNYLEAVRSFGNGICICLYYAFYALENAL